MKLPLGEADGTLGEADRSEPRRSSQEQERRVYKRRNDFIELGFMAFYGYLVHTGSRNRDRRIILLSSSKASNYFSVFLVFHIVSRTPRGRAMKGAAN